MPPPRNLVWQTHGGKSNGFRTKLASLQSGVSFGETTTLAGAALEAAGAAVEAATKAARKMSAVEVKSTVIDVASKSTRQISRRREKILMMWQTFVNSRLVAFYR